MDDGALIHGMVRVNYLRAGESEEGVGGNEYDANGIVVNGTPPLVVMVCGDGEGRLNESFPEGRERSIIRLVN